MQIVSLAMFFVTFLAKALVNFTLTLDGISCDQNWTKFRLIFIKSSKQTTSFNEK